MNCETFNERISEFLDNEMASPLVDEMNAHLQGCDACKDELHTLQSLKTLVACSPIPPGTGPTWEVLAARLDSNRTSPVSLTKFPEQRRQAKTAIALSLAAVLLLAMGLRFVMTTKPSVVDQAGIAFIDLQSVVELFSTSPEFAMNSLTSRYAGNSTKQRETPTGYQIISTKSLPMGFQLVSTEVIELPLCQCIEGRCTCGPGQCECVACICKRPDGTTFLIVENCRSYGVSFGDLETETVWRNGQSHEQIRVDDVLAVSWSVNHRQLTAIGLTDERETDSLRAASFSPN